MTLACTLNDASELVVLEDAPGGECQLAFEFHGDRSLPVVLVLGGISAQRHVASHAQDPTTGWWEDLVGPHGLDRTRYCLLGVDFVGGAGDSCVDPAAQPGTPWTPQQQAEALERLRRRLGLPPWHACVGASYGGMVALALAEQHPGSLQRLIVLSAPAVSHPQATAWRAVQRGILELGLETGREQQAVVLARALAMATYRTAEELAERFPSPLPVSPSLPVEEYLLARGTAFAQEFPAQAFCNLSRSADAHWVDPSRIQVPTTLVASRTDRLVPLVQMEGLAAHLPRLQRLVVLDSPFGHDAFLKEPIAVGQALRRALEETP